VAHIDATPDDLVRQVKRRHKARADHLLSGRVQYITIWKPLRGPLYDYPLALCDKQSVDVRKDLEPQDIVDRDEVLENVHVYHRKKHAWYYLNGQKDTELLIFRQADTLQGGYGKSHHEHVVIARLSHDTFLQGHPIAPYQIPLLLPIVFLERASRSSLSSTARIETAFHHSPSHT
jgi:hypothetical protein